MKKYITAAAVIVLAVLIAGSKAKNKPTGYDTYVVSYGDTVCDIARAITPESIDYRHTVQIIADKNDLADYTIYPGQELSVPEWEE